MQENLNAQMDQNLLADPVAFFLWTECEFHDYVSIKVNPIKIHQ